MSAGQVDRLTSVLGAVAARMQPESTRDPGARSEGVRRRKVQVATLNANGTVDVQFPAPSGGNIVIPGVSVQRSASPAVGDWVWLEISGTDPHLGSQLGPPQWIAATLLNGATNDSSSTHNVAAYAMHPGGVVGLRGRVRLGASGVGVDLFTLPVGFRPTKINVLRVIHWSTVTWAVGFVDVTTAGAVIPGQATNGEVVILDGSFFSLW